MAEHKMPAEEPNLPSNSNKAKRLEEKHVQKVISGTASVKKPTGWERFRERVGFEDGRTVKDFVFWDVFLPKTIDLVVDIIKTTADTFFYGGSKPANVRREGRKSYVSYSSYYDRDDRRDVRRGSYSSRAARDMQDVVFEDRKDAEMVLSEMIDIIDEYGVCKVSDFYELAGVEQNYTDHGLCWDKLGSAGVERTRNGYVIRLPRPIRLD